MNGHAHTQGDNGIRAMALSWLQAALPALLLTLLMPFSILLLPSLTTLLLTLITFLFALFYFFYRLAANSPPIKSRGTIATLTAAVGFILILAAENSMIQDKLLFGYKAVDDALSPSLVNGDHYFGDKWLFRGKELKKGDVYVIRNNRDKVFAARLLYFPGDTIALEGKLTTLKDGQYGFYSGRKTSPAEIIESDGILAKAVVIYWCFDPYSNAPVLERSGQVIH